MLLFLALYTQILKISARYVLSCYLGYILVNNLKKYFFNMGGLPPVWGGQKSPKMCARLL